MCKSGRGRRIYVHQEVNCSSEMASSSVSAMVGAVSPTVQSKGGRANGVLARLKVNPDRNSDNEQTLGWGMTKSSSQVLAVPYFPMALA